MTSPPTPREFAIHVVEKLRKHGYDALWAGGCVRDLLLDRKPKDYDVATNATPEQVREVFGKQKTLPVGAAFGVIIVRGSRGVEPIEVATFRMDTQYSDGRRPDAVIFSTAEQDAQRRDFTINGLFYDPIEEQTIDYVDGQTDLKRRVVRAIGNPADRINEDKLRMLRAVRFTATLGFDLEASTKEAVRSNATSLSIVSAERIASELRRMLTHDTRRHAVELLHETCLLEQVFPEISEHRASPWWTECLTALERLEAPSFPTSLATLLNYPGQTKKDAEAIGRRLKLSNDEISCTSWLIGKLELAKHAHQRPWPEVQRTLIDPRAKALMTFATANAAATKSENHGLEFCRDRLSWPADKLSPPPLVDGNDLIQAGLKPGKAFRALLERIRDAQLDDTITTFDEAVKYAHQILPELQSD